MVSLFFFLFFLNNCTEAGDLEFVPVNIHTTKLNQTSPEHILHSKVPSHLEYFFLMEERWIVIKMNSFIIYLAFYNGRSTIAVLSVTLSFFHSSRLQANPQHFATFVMGGRMEGRRWRPREVKEWAQDGLQVTSHAEMRIWRWDLGIPRREEVWLMAWAKLIWEQCLPHLRQLICAACKGTAPQTMVFLRRVIFLQWERSCQWFWTLKTINFQAFPLFAQK